METKEHRKIARSESLSVHLCSKCGWPYPKPHPSAKQRRAHRKMCGTIEGYKLIDLPNLGVSDNERGSDEDLKTPSPKLEKRSSEEISVGGGGVGGRSNRSEDEVFSDAVTEFSDSPYSPVDEDRLKGVIVSDKKVGSLVECDSDSKQQPEVVVSTGSVPALNCATDSSQMYDAESKSLASVPTEDIASNGNSHPLSSSDNRTEDLPLEISNVDVSARSQISAASPVEDVKENVVEQETRSSTKLLEQEASVKEKQENGSDEVLSDIVVTPSELSKEASEFSSLGPETDSEISVNVTSDQGKNLSYTDQTKADSPQDRDVLSHGGSIGGCNTEAEKEEYVHVLSVDDIPVVGHAAVLIEDFKDHKPVKSNLPVTLDFKKEIEHVGDAKKDTINDDDGFSFHPRKPDESAAITSTGLPLLEGELQQKDGGSIVSGTEVPSEATADMSDLSVSYGGLGPNHAEAPPQTTSEKSQSESCKKDHDLSVTKADQSINLLAVDSSKYSENGHEVSDATGTGTGSIPEMVSNTTLISAHSSEPHVIFDDATNNFKNDLQESATPFHEVIVEGGLDASSVGNTAVSHSSQQDMLREDSLEVMKESKVDTTNEVPVETVGTVPECPRSSQDIGAVVSHNSKETSVEPFSVEADLVRRSTGEVDIGRCTNGIVDGTKQLQEEHDENFTNQPVKTPVIDVSVDSSSQSDSLEVNWGSISGSAFSTQSDAHGAAIDAVTPPPATSEVPEKTELQKPETDAFEAPSFMTLVEPENKVGQEAPSDVTQHGESEDLRAAWFPSITNVVNDSEGRRKNEEIIAKVTNWSTGVNHQPQQQHTPLKSLLVETKMKSPPRKEEKGRKENDAPVLTVNSILGREAGTDEDAKREIGKEWDSPARYPSEIKKEKKKSKGRPYWVPFACCSSVN